MPELEEKAVATRTSNLAVTTTTETVVISSGPVKVPRQTCLVHVRAWTQFGTGVACTYVMPRIRRGTTIAGALVGREEWEIIKSAAGNVEQYSIDVIEERSGQDTVEYSLTLQQTAATGDGQVKQSAIEVEILGG